MVCASLVIDPDTPEAFATADKARSRIRIKNHRSCTWLAMQARKMPIWSVEQIEVLGKEIEVLAASETPPFPLNDENTNISEEIRSKYRSWTSVVQKC